MASNGLENPFFEEEPRDFDNSVEGWAHNTLNSAVYDPTGTADSIWQGFKLMGTETMEMISKVNDAVNSSWARRHPEIVKRAAANIAQQRTRAAESVNPGAATIAEVTGPPVSAPLGLAAKGIKLAQILPPLYLARLADKGDEGVIAAREFFFQERAKGRPDSAIERDMQEKFDISITSDPEATYVGGRAADDPEYPNTKPGHLPYVGYTNKGSTIEEGGLYAEVFGNRGSYIMKNADQLIDLKLYKDADPELFGNMKVQVGPDITTYAAYDHSTNTILFNSKRYQQDATAFGPKVAQERLMSSLEHELFHAIQGKYYFGKGGSSAEAGRMLDRAATLIREKKHLGLPVEDYKALQDSTEMVSKRLVEYTKADVMQQSNNIINSTTDVGKRTALLELQGKIVGAKSRDELLQLEKEWRRLTPESMSTWATDNMFYTAVAKVYNTRAYETFVGERSSFLLESNMRLLKDPAMRDKTYGELGRYLAHRVVSKDSAEWMELLRSEVNKHSGSFFGAH
jgi:hypothetical protein